MPFNQRVAHRAEKELGYGAETMQHVRSHIHQTRAPEETRTIAYVRLGSTRVKSGVLTMHHRYQGAPI